MTTAPRCARGRPHLFGGIAEGTLDGVDNLLAKLRIVAAGFGLQLYAIGDDVRRLAAVDEADVARAAPLPLGDLPVPALFVQTGDRQRRDGDRAHALLRRNARMAGQALHFDFHPIAAGRADRDSFRRAAVPVERQLRIAQQFQIGVSRAVQADLFLNRPEKRQRRMRQLVSQDGQAPRSDITAAPARSSAPKPVRGSAERTKFPFDHRLGCPGKSAPCPCGPSAAAAGRAACRAI